MKKRIVCFGDSNTWGYDPVSGKRFDEDTRWTGRLQKLLGEDYCVIEEGQNGRTIASPDPWEWGTKCGMDYVLPMLESQMPVDVLVIMLGGNDLKRKFHLPAPDVAGSLQNMLLRVRSHLRVYLNSPQTRILVVAPRGLPKAVLRLFLMRRTHCGSPGSWPAGTAWWPNSLAVHFLTPLRWLSRAKWIACIYPHRDIRPWRMRWQ